MKYAERIVSIVVLLTILWGGSWFGIFPSAQAAPPTPATRPGAPIIIRASTEISSLRITAPRYARATRAPATTITINFLANGTQNGFGDSCAEWPEQAKVAVNYAASIWASLLSSSMPIRVNACWTNLGAGILGYSGGTSFHRDTAGAVPGLWYTAALANNLAHTDLNDNDQIDWDGDGQDADGDIEIAIGTRLAWYFGTDGDVPPGQYDLVTVTLHEITHGLGFSGWMYYASGQGSWGYSTGYPAIYDRFTENSAGQNLTNTSLFLNPSPVLGMQLTSNNVYFNGPNAKAANGGNRPKLYTPVVWRQGSSYSHLDEIYNGTANALMTFSLGYQEVIQQPGPITTGIMQDLGWTLATDCYTLSTNPLPNSGGSVNLTPAPNCREGRYLPLTNVTLTATPNSGYTFSTWSGSVNAKTISVNTVMNTDKNVAAVFNTASTQYIFIPFIRK